MRRRRGRRYRRPWPTSLSGGSARPRCLLPGPWHARWRSRLGPRWVRGRSARGVKSRQDAFRAAGLKLCPDQALCLDCSVSVCGAMTAVLTSHGRSQEFKSPHLHSAKPCRAVRDVYLGPRQRDAWPPSRRPGSRCSSSVRVRLAAWADAVDLRTDHGGLATHRPDKAAASAPLAWRCSGSRPAAKVIQHGGCNSIRTIFDTSSAASIRCRAR